MRSAYIFLLLCCAAVGCRNNEPATSDANNAAANPANALFTPLNYEESGITFKNRIVEQGKFNIFTYEYLYNGAGVAVGDINNDGLTDIYFSGNMVPNKLFLNKGNLKFEDITETAGVGCNQGYKTGVTMADVNGDGFLDLYVCRSVSAESSDRQNLLFINNGDLTFSERAQEYGLNNAGYSTQAYFFDYDKDNDLDCYLLNHPRKMTDANDVPLVYDENNKLTIKEDTTQYYVADRFYENTGNKFVEANKKVKLRPYDNGFGLSAAIADFNNDFHEDIFVANDYIRPDFYYQNTGKKTFSEEADRHFQHFSLSSMGSDCGDINNDGFLDLFVVDMAADDAIRQKQLFSLNTNHDKFKLIENSGLGCQYAKNMLHINNGDGTFSEVAHLLGMAATDWSWTPLFADFDNDGWQDLFVANGLRRDLTDWDYKVYGIDSIKKYQQSNPQQQIKIDELLKALPSVPLSNYLYHNKGNLVFENVAAAWGLDKPNFTNGCAYADFDNDGDLDLVMNHLDELSVIYRNNAQNQQTQNNYLRIRLEGDGKNPNGIGSVVKITLPDGSRQIRNLMPTRGYLSTVEPYLHFGLGKETSVAKIEIFWANGKYQMMEDLKANQAASFKIAEAQGSAPPTTSPKPLFENITTATVQHFSPENDYIDFKREPLLPHKFSQGGPNLSGGDVNGDGLQDFFVGGCKGQAGAIYLQQKNGKFERSKANALTFAADSSYEDAESLLLDTDQDGDLDLYVVSGGNEYEAESPFYQDRLYINDGKGNFSRSTQPLPKTIHSGACIAAHDIDGDGDLDLFRGGKVISGQYPLPPRSYLLRNNQGVFTDITEQAAPALKNIGMVTTALWADTDGDQQSELIIAGEWLPITVLKQKNNVFETTESGTANSKGWWNVLLAEDMDGDGDLDLIGGNRGLNCKITATEQEPATVDAKDFDKNGSVDALISYYIQGKSYPMYMRDQLFERLPYLKRRLLRYKNYSGKSIAEILNKEELQDALHLEAKNFATTYFENTGKGVFTAKTLPIYAQFSTVQAMAVRDFDGDGIKDILLCGNDYSPEVATVRYDASVGLLLKGMKNGTFAPIHPLVSGFKVRGEAKYLLPLQTASGEEIYIIAQTNDSLQVYRKRKG